MAISLRLTTRPTDEEILELSERNPGLQIEQSATGELIVSPTGSGTGRRGVKLVVQLDRWAEAKGSGPVFGPSAGFRLPDGSLRSPDAAWMSRARWEALTPAQQEGFAPLCPDAVFEILSSCDTIGNLRGKMLTYLANGARLAVLIDPDRRAVEIYMPDQHPQVIEPARSVSLDPILAGFTIDLEPIFA